MEMVSPMKNNSISKPIPVPSNQLRSSIPMSYQPIPTHWNSPRRSPCSPVKRFPGLNFPATSRIGLPSHLLLSESKKFPATTIHQKEQPESQPVSASLRLNHKRNFFAEYGNWTNVNREGAFFDWPARQIDRALRQFHWLPLPALFRSKDQSNPPLQSD